MSFLFPKMPSIPPMVMPEVKEVPNYESADREAAERAKLEAAEKKRKGRRSTILTGGSGLTTDPDLNQPTLLG